LFPDKFYTKGVGQFQPRVGFETLGKEFGFLISTLKGFAISCGSSCHEPFQGYTTITYLIPGLPKLNPGLEFAYTFGVMVNALVSVSHLTVAICDCGTGQELTL
jgi:hypothetical protein